jgi:cytochrome c oxidase assembly protein Cox11
MEEPKQMPKSVALAIGLTFATIGIIAMIAGVLWYRSTKERLKTMINHIGIVVEMIRVERPRETANFYPVIEFETQTGKVFRFESRTGGSETSYKIGESVEILYDPQDSQGAMINSWTELWLPPIAVMMLGGSVLIVGIFSCSVAILDKS